MEDKKKLADFVKCFKNSRNNQKTLTVSSRKMKKYNLNMNDLLNTEVNKKIRDFKEGK
ncbi:MAG: hypothetical protein ACOC56_00470 [Atribacterota bacterium]